MTINIEALVKALKDEFARFHEESDIKQTESFEQFMQRLFGKKDQKFELEKLLEEWVHEIEDTQLRILRNPQELDDATFYVQPFVAPRLLVGDSSPTLACYDSLGRQVIKPSLRVSGLISKVQRELSEQKQEIAEPTVERTTICLYCSLGEAITRVALSIKEKVPSGDANADGIVNMLIKKFSDVIMQDQQDDISSMFTNPAEKRSVLEKTVVEDLPNTRPLPSKELQAIISNIRELYTFINNVEAIVKYYEIIAKAQKEDEDAKYTEQNKLVVEEKAVIEKTVAALKAREKKSKETPQEQVLRQMRTQQDAMLLMALRMAAGICKIPVSELQKAQAKELVLRIFATEEGVNLWRRLASLDPATPGLQQISTALTYLVASRSATLLELLKDKVLTPANALKIWEAFRNLPSAHDLETQLNTALAVVGVTVDEAQADHIKQEILRDELGNWVLAKFLEPFTLKKSKDEHARTQKIIRHRTQEITRDIGDQIQRILHISPYVSAMVSLRSQVHSVRDCGVDVTSAEPTDVQKRMQAIVNLRAKTLADKLKDRFPEEANLPANSNAMHVAVYWFVKSLSQGDIIEIRAAELEIALLLEIQPNLVAQTDAKGNSPLKLLQTELGGKPLAPRTPAEKGQQKEWHPHPVITAYGAIIEGVEKDLYEAERAQKSPLKSVAAKMPKDKFASSVRKIVQRAEELYKTEKEVISKFQYLDEVFQKFLSQMPAPESETDAELQDYFTDLIAEFTRLRITENDSPYITKLREIIQLYQERLLGEGVDAQSFDGALEMLKKVSLAFTEIDGLKAADVKAHSQRLQALLMFCEFKLIPFVKVLQRTASPGVLGKMFQNFFEKDATIFDILIRPTQRVTGNINLLFKDLEHDVRALEGLAQESVKVNAGEGKKEGIQEKAGEEKVPEDEKEKEKIRSSLGKLSENVKALIDEAAAGGKSANSRITEVKIDEWRRVFGEGMISMKLAGFFEAQTNLPRPYGSDGKLLPDSKDKEILSQIRAILTFENLLSEPPREIIRSLNATGCFKLDPNTDVVVFNDIKRLILLDIVKQISPSLFKAYEKATLADLQEILAELQLTTFTAREVETPTGEKIAVYFPTDHVLPEEKMQAKFAAFAAKHPSLQQVQGQAQVIAHEIKQTILHNRLKSISALLDYLTGGHVLKKLRKGGSTQAALDKFGGSTQAALDTLGERVNDFFSSTKVDRFIILSEILKLFNEITGGSIKAEDLSKSLISFVKVKLHLPADTRDDEVFPLHGAVELLIEGVKSNDVMLQQEASLLILMVLQTNPKLAGVRRDGLLPSQFLKLQIVTLQEEASLQGAKLPEPMWSSWLMPAFNRALISVGIIPENPVNQVIYDLIEFSKQPQKPFDVSKWMNSVAHLVETIAGVKGQQMPEIKEGEEAKAVPPRDIKILRAIEDSKIFDAFSVSALLSINDARTNISQALRGMPPSPDHTAAQEFLDVTWRVVWEKVKSLAFSQIDKATQDAVAILRAEPPEAAKLMDAYLALRSAQEQFFQWRFWVEKVSPLAIKEQGLASRAGLAYKGASVQLESLQEKIHSIPAKDYKLNEHATVQARALRYLEAVKEVWDLTTTQLRDLFVRIKDITTLDQFMSWMGDLDIRLNTTLGLGGVKAAHEHVLLAEKLYAWAHPKDFAAFISRIGEVDTVYEPCHFLTDTQKTEYQLVLSDAQPEWFKALPPFAQSYVKRMIETQGLESLGHLPALLRSFPGAANAGQTACAVSGLPPIKYLHSAALLPIDLRGVLQEAELAEIAKENLRQLIYWHVSKIPNLTAGQEIDLPVLVQSLVTPTFATRTDLAVYEAKLAAIKRLQSEKQPLEVTIDGKKVFLRLHLIGTNHPINCNAGTILPKLGLGWLWEKLTPKFVTGSLYEDNLSAAVELLHVVAKSPLFSSIMDLPAFAGPAWNEFRVFSVDNVRSGKLAKMLTKEVLDGLPPEQKLLLSAIKTYLELNESDKYKDVRKGAALSRAALELMLMDMSGGLGLTSCKSGKDRTGLNGVWLRAMLRYFSLHKEFPDLQHIGPLSDVEGVQKFQSFVGFLEDELRAGYAQLICDQNAKGVLAVKFMEEILPREIYIALAEREFDFSAQKLVGKLGKPQLALGTRVKAAVSLLGRSKSLPKAESDLTLNRFIRFVSEAAKIDPEQFKNLTYRIKENPDVSEQIKVLRSELRKLEKDVRDVEVAPIEESLEGQERSQDKIIPLLVSEFEKQGQVNAFSLTTLIILRGVIDSLSTQLFLVSTEGTTKSVLIHLEKYKDQIGVADREDYNKAIAALSVNNAVGIELLGKLTKYEVVRTALFYLRKPEDAVRFCWYMSAAMFVIQETAYSKAFVQLQTALSFASRATTPEVRSLANSCLHKAREEFELCKEWGSEAQKAAADELLPRVDSELAVLSHDLAPTEATKVITSYEPNLQSAIQTRARQYFKAAVEVLHLSEEQAPGFQVAIDSLKTARDFQLWLDSLEALLKTTVPGIKRIGEAHKQLMLAEQLYTWAHPEEHLYKFAVQTEGGYAEYQPVFYLTAKQETEYAELSLGKTPEWFKSLPAFAQDYILATIGLGKDRKVPSHLPSSLRSFPGAANAGLNTCMIRDGDRWYAVRYVNSASLVPIDLAKRHGKDKLSPEALSEITQENLVQLIESQLQRLPDLAEGQVVPVVVQSLVSPLAALVPDPTDDSLIYREKEAAVEALKSKGKDGLLALTVNGKQVKIKLISTNHPINVLSRFPRLMDKDQFSRNLGRANDLLLTVVDSRLFASAMAKLGMPADRLKEPEFQDISSGWPSLFITKDRLDSLSGEDRLLLSAVKFYFELNFGGRRHEDASNGAAMNRAALELLLVDLSGGVGLTSCKSGKDRSGVIGLWLRAMLGFYAKWKEFPDLQHKRTPKEIEKFKSFVSFFRSEFASGYAQLISGQNAMGADATKSLELIFPKDILDELVRQGFDFKTQQQVAALNKPKVPALVRLRSSFSRAAIPVPAEEPEAHVEAEREIESKSVIAARAQEHKVGRLEEMPVSFDELRASMISIINEMGRKLKDKDFESTDLKALFDALDEKIRRYSAAQGMSPEKITGEYLANEKKKLWEQCRASAEALVIPQEAMTEARELISAASSGVLTIDSLVGEERALEPSVPEEAAAAAAPVAPSSAEVPLPSVSPGSPSPAVGISSARPESMHRITMDDIQKYEDALLIYRPEGKGKSSEDVYATFEEDKQLLHIPPAASAERQEQYAEGLIKIISGKSFSAWKESGIKISFYDESGFELAKAAIAKAKDHGISVVVGRIPTQYRVAIEDIISKAAAEGERKQPESPRPSSSQKA